MPMSGECMKYTIFGTKKEALYLASELKKRNLGELQVFIDNDRNKQGTVLDGINVVSLEQFKSEYRDMDSNIIIAIRGSYSRLAVLDQLERNGIQNIGVFKFSYCDYGKAINNLDESVIWLNELNVPFMPYLEYNVADSCNLKCKGCTHFSNLCGEDVFAVFENFRNDIKQISSKVCIGQLRLLGGEPLLHRQLSSFVRCARELLPDADINIVSNGVLIPRLPQELFMAMRDCNVGFHISRYIPTDRQIDTIEKTLMGEGVDFYIEKNIVEEFCKTLNMSGNSNVEKTQKACISLGCRFLKDGRLYKCPFEGLINYFVEYYGYKDFPHNEGIDIYDENQDWKIVLEDLYKKPVEMCKYCAESNEMFKWKVETKPKKEDWLVGF